MSGGQHRVDEVTRTESRGLDRKNNPRIAAHRPPKETAGLRNAGVCAKGTKKESNTLDAADLVRDVANRDYHYLSQECPRILVISGVGVEKLAHWREF